MQRECAEGATDWTVCECGRTCWGREIQNGRYVSEYRFDGEFWQASSLLSGVIIL